MSLEHPQESTKQSPGADPKTKRNSGLFAFFKWFKSSTSRESLDNSYSSSCDSLTSLKSSGTVASFSFVPPSAYGRKIPDKSIQQGPETDTYKARLKQRDKRRENDKNLTLRKKYNLFFNRETLLRVVPRSKDEETSKSLPLMTKRMQEEQEKLHRRTNSDSSKLKKAGAYLHVKGKRKAPQPPGTKTNGENVSTLSLKRKKRLAPSPPSLDIISNDCLKLEEGVLKPVKEGESSEQVEEDSHYSSPRSSYIEMPVSPKPWYKRNTSGVKKEEHKYELVGHLPNRNSNVDLTASMEDIKPDKKKEEKRKSGMAFLSNISELDREASEIIKREHLRNGSEIPEFMKPKEDSSKINSELWPSPKRRSAKDLIAKFNAITSVTKVTVNTALFGGGVKENGKKDYFGRSISHEEKKQEMLLEMHKKKIEKVEKRQEERLKNPIMKSESASAVKKPDTPKSERKAWMCPKCSAENEYWRIICHVCSTIKPYFDDLASNKPLEKPISKEAAPIKSSPERILERSRTQIGFSVLANYNQQNRSVEEQQKDDKKEEREKLKKMLIEMKNSLPKRKTNITTKNSSRTSVIVENPESDFTQNKDDMTINEVTPTEVTPKEDTPSKEIPDKNNLNLISQNEKKDEKTAELIVATKETIYENIKVKKGENIKPIKVSSSAQTSSVMKKPLSPTLAQVIQEHEKKKNFELMRPKDFEDLYSDKNGQSAAARIYANLAQNDELSMFFNMPKNFNDFKDKLGKGGAKPRHKDTIEINRLLRRLETAIAKGDMTEASLFAKELAQLKVNCSVVRQKSEEAEKLQGKEMFGVDLYVEDKVSHRGPFTLQVTQDQSVAGLKKQVEKEFEIPVNVQRWILGKQLVMDDNTSLKDNNITTEGCPIFLYLVAPDNKFGMDNSIIGNQEKSGASISADLNSRNPEITSNVELDNQKDLKEKHAPKIIEVIPKDAVKNIDKIDQKVTKEDNFLNQCKTTASNIKAEATASFVKNDIASAGSITTQHQKEKSKDVEGARNFAVIIDKPQVLGPVSQNATIQTNNNNNDLENEDYDSKTLKPQATEWECHLCTLLNPMTSNICAVCATVRKKASHSLKKKAPQIPQPEKKLVQDEETYMQLVNLDNTDLVQNREPFECVICFMDIPPGQGVTLRECLHQFCKQCLRHTIEFTEEVEIKCPYRDDQYSCNIALQDREIKALVSKTMYDQFLARSVAQAENKMDNSFHCKTPDCRGWCIYEDNVNEFRCPVCRRFNCLTCQAIHTGLNCKQYQERMNQASEVDDDAKRTKEMLDEMVTKGEALACPTCQVVLMKKWGCDWLRCSMCKTEICWVTRGPRWGPAGKGDTSGGCQCGVNGVKCHPKCNYCH